MLLIGIPAILIIMLITHFLFFKDNNGLQEALLVIPIVFGIIFTIIVLTVSLETTSHVIRLETFYDTNAQNLSALVNKAQAFISTSDFSDKMISGSIEKTSITTSIVEIMRDRTADVNKYNLELASHRFWQNNWAGKYIVVPVREDLKLIVIE